MDKIVVMGHSMGGATALMSAAAELRFKAVVGLDPWMYPIKDEPLDLISQPVLFINTETLSKGANKTKMAELMTGEGKQENDPGQWRQSVTINGSKHLQQSDVPYIFGWLALLLSGNLSRESANPFVVQDLSSYLSLQFIAKFLGMSHCFSVFTSFRRVVVSISLPLSFHFSSHDIATC